MKATYEINSNGKSTYYRTLAEARKASVGRNIWKVVNGTANLVKPALKK